MTDRVQVAIPLFPRFTALDAVGPYEVLQRIPNFDIVFVGHTPGEVRSENGMLGLTADATFEEVPAPTVVVFPGGTGTRALQHDERVLAWVREAHAGTRFTTSVCTGSLVLGAAGLLRGLTATTHWACYRELAAHGAVPTPERVVEHRRGADHHRGRSVERHRHGTPADRAAGRSHRRPGGPAHDRVRPAAAVRLRVGGQGGRRRHDTCRGVRRAREWAASRSGAPDSVHSSAAAALSPAKRPNSVLSPMESPLA